MGLVHRIATPLLSIIAVAGFVAGLTASRGAAAEPHEVVLGTGDLCTGIPGEGPLTAAQIDAWLAQQDVLDPLAYRLPAGLSAAAAQIRGIEKNPITRAKIELGRQLYFDRRLSADASVSCADCHHPDEGYGRHTQFGIGIRQQTGGRNSPVSYNRILSGAQFWDGRAASLEEQAVGPIANPIEMGNTHEQAVRTVAAIDGYQRQFARIFPEEGITIATIGKAIATFERVLVTGPAPYDHFEVVRAVEAQFDEDERATLAEDDPELFGRYQQALEGSKSMSDGARRGRDLFFSDRVGCTACHAGANFTDELYHNIGVGMEAANPDWGRYEVTRQDKDRGAFKTPTLRNVSLSAPYMHDGSQQTLEEVVLWYDKGGHPNRYLSEKIKKIGLTDQEKRDLIAFMDALTGDMPDVETGRLPQ